ncbi:MAG: biotin--[acetyl-CoA-carboxylase] ligase [Tannerellaceae bacterium]|nr:biotin--[acetyl-CoA-carboxylase] ligase [Tannerellaceae bacterium]
MENKEVPVILRLEETNSTNQYVREYLQKEKLPEGSVVVAQFQTAGRGQTGNSWESAAGENLLFSTVLYPDFIPANRQFIISQITALSVQETLSRYTGEITIKWPNDIYWKEKKISGMLIENDLTGKYIYTSIQGIGININQKQFRSNAPNPVSLYQITGKTYTKEDILQEFLQLFYTYYLDLLQEKEEQIHTRYMQRLFRGEGYHPFRENERTFEACIGGIEPTGHLILEDKAGHQARYAFKEVSFVV